MPLIWFNLIRKGHYCGVVAEAYDSQENVLIVRFFATKEARESEFKFLYTAFRRKNGTECVEGQEFDCEDDLCISRSLVCNEIANCKFKKDEGEASKCGVRICQTSLYIISCSPLRRNQMLNLYVVIARFTEMFLYLLTFAAR